MSQNKKPILVINASHPFPLKNRCKHCGSKNLVFYQDYSNPYWYPDIKYAKNRNTPDMVRGWMHGTHIDKELAPFKRAGIRLDPQHSIAFKRYNPKLSKSWSGGQGRHYISQMVVMIVCDDCDMQTWAYMNSYYRKMPENFNRKARINCPQKINPMEWLY